MPMLGRKDGRGTRYGFGKSPVKITAENESWQIKEQLFY
jgi:hypothetical protein